MEVLCIICGKPFTPKNAKGVMCSGACRVRSSRNNKKKLVTQDNVVILEVKKEFDMKKPLITNKDEFIVPAKPTTKGSFDGSNVDALKFDEGIFFEKPKQYTILDYKLKIEESMPFQDDLKKLAELIKNDDSISILNRRDLLASFGAKM